MPRLRLVQSVATGIELFDLAALPRGVAVCNAFGHETAIAEYIVMVMLALHHRLLRDFRRVPRARLVAHQLGGERRAAWRGARLDARHRRLWPGRAGGGAARGAVRGAHPRRQPQRRASPNPGSSASIRSPNSTACCPLCDTVALCTALGPETTGLIDARRLALMKPTAFLINIARGQVVDEDALYAALARRHDRRRGARCVVAISERRRSPSGAARAIPFHELPNVIVTPHNSGWTAGHGAAALGRDRRQYRPLRPRRAAHQRGRHDLKEPMKALFLGNFGGRVAPLVLAKVTEKLDTTVLSDIGDAQRLIPALAEAEIVVSHIWKKDFPEAPQLKLLQSPAAGLDLIDVPSLPRGVTVCNVVGHEQAIAEYVLMTALVLTHRLFDIATAFRDQSSWLAGGAGGGPPHGELFGKTVGIIGYGKIGREVAKRAAGFGCTIIAANRSPIADKGDASEIYPLAELDRMLPRCDVVVIAAALGPETRGLIDARRLALMKPTAHLINIGRALIVDEEALYAALREHRIGGAAIDVWWRYPNPAEPNARPANLPFHELPNVLMTPHCSSATDGARDRRFSAIAGNLDRYVRGEVPGNVVART